MDEINKLKMMLEGKARVDYGVISAVGSNSGSGGDIVREKVVYRDGDSS